MQNQTSFTVKSKLSYGQICVLIMSSLVCFGVLLYSINEIVIVAPSQQMINSVLDEVQSQLVDKNGGGQWPSTTLSAAEENHIVSKMSILPPQGILSINWSWVKASLAFIASTILSYILNLLLDFIRGWLLRKCPKNR